MPKLKPNTFQSIYCPVCGTLNTVKRNQLGPTNVASAMAGIESLYDEFDCPYFNEPWHAEAVELQQKLEETTSKRVRELYRLDLEEILAAHGCQIPTGELYVVFDEIKAMKADILSNGKNYLTIEYLFGNERKRNAIYFYDQRFYLILQGYEIEGDLEDFRSFAEAFENPLLNMAIETTTAIESEVFSAEEIKGMVTFVVRGEKTILINGEEHRVKYIPPYPQE